jgi:hypothetical protein
MRLLLPIALAFLTGCLVATVGPSLAADRADDFILTIDVEAGGNILRRLSFAQHVDIPTADWPGMRTAAGTSQAALDAWFVSYQNGAWNGWWSTLGANRRAQARGAILTGS